MDLENEVKSNRLRTENRLSKTVTDWKPKLNSNLRPEPGSDYGYTFCNSSDNFNFTVAILAEVTHRTDWGICSAKKLIKPDQSVCQITHRAVLIRKN